MQKKFKLLITGSVLMLCFASIKTKAFVVSDTLILVQGIIADKENNEPVAAILTYEKLPYYDDIGIARSSEKGHFRLHLVNGHTYTIIVEANGYKTLSRELLATSRDSNLELVKDFQLEPTEEVLSEVPIALDNLIFARGRALITSQSHDELDKLVKWLEDHPQHIIQLEGHTDFAGSPIANMKLSFDRVEAVRDYLLQKGIRKKRVLTKAFGGANPLTRERTEEAKARNRRVEVRIINN